MVTGRGGAGNWRTAAPDRAIVIVAAGGRGVVWPINCARPLVHSAELMCCVLSSSQLRGEYSSDSGVTSVREGFYIYDFTFFPVSVFYQTQHAFLHCNLVTRVCKGI